MKLAAEQTAPKMRMATDIPPQITTPDFVETRLGTLKFFDGFPDDGRWPVHHECEGLCPIHRGFIAMSGIAFRPATTSRSRPPFHQCASLIRVSESQPRK